MLSSLHFSHFPVHVHKTSRETTPVFLIYAQAIVCTGFSESKLFLFCFLPSSTYVKFKYPASTKWEPLMCILDPVMSYSFFSPLSAVA